MYFTNMFTYTQGQNTKDGSQAFKIVPLIFFFENPGILSNIYDQIEIYVFSASSQRMGVLHWCLTSQRPYIFGIVSDQININVFFSSSQRTGIFVLAPDQSETSNHLSSLTGQRPHIFGSFGLDRNSYVLHKQSDKRFFALVPDQSETSYFWYSL